MTRQAKLQCWAFWLMLLSCITASMMETHLLLGLWVTAGLICTAGVLVVASNL